MYVPLTEKRNKKVSPGKAHVRERAGSQKLLACEFTDFPVPFIFSLVKRR